MRFARRRPAAQDPVADMRRFAREALDAAMRFLARAHWEPVE